MSLPFSPEPIDRLRARFPKAMATAYSVLYCQRFPSEGPSGRPEHVFDFIHEGVNFRVIVSLDEHPQFGRALHASVSCGMGRPTIETAVWAFAQICGPGVLSAKGHYITEGVTHLIFDLSQSPVEVRRGHV